MFCKYCGQKLPDETRFCTSCGAALKPAPTQQTAPASPQYTAPAPVAPAASAPADVKELRSYLQTSIVWAIVGIILMILGAISLIMVGQIVTCIVIVAFGALMTLTGVNSKRSMDKLIADLTESGELTAVLREFNSATSLVDDKIRLGETYAFGKKTDRVVRYTDIRKLYQSIRKKNFAESRRTLEYVSADGKTYTLCDLKLKGKSDEDMKKIMLVVATKNPSVHLGYK